MSNSTKQPNVLLIMCDQLRTDSLGISGHPLVKTPNFDRLARRGVRMTNGYSSCPVCVPARYSIRTGCEPYTTLVYQNEFPQPGMEDRCGSYLPRTMLQHGYRTFGVGKFHTLPWHEDLGYEVQKYSEEIYESAEQREGDHYAKWIAEEHPHFDYIGQLHGERTEMYYMPQTSPLPAELTVEHWAAEQVVKQLKSDDERPFFGFLSFVGPHPPLAPPIPWNRMYNPEHVDSPVVGELAIDHQDDQIPWGNHLVWADDINDTWARTARARYLGEVSYIDECLGKVLDALEQRDDAEDTIICFFSDHGDHLGDHHGWQKESFFDASCHVPYFISWPRRLEPNQVNEMPVTLTDLFAIATRAAGQVEVRDGYDALGHLLGEGIGAKRLYANGFYGKPGTRDFKLMLADTDWKYIYLANGGVEQLFHRSSDHHEIDECSARYSEKLQELRQAALLEVKRHETLRPAMKFDVDGADLFEDFAFEHRPRVRIRQFDPSRGVTDFTL